MEEHKMNHEHGCASAMWCGKKHSAIRVLVALVIVAIVFGLGIQVGRFEGRFGRHHRYGGYQMMESGNAYYGPRMMGSWGSGSYGPQMMQSYYGSKQLPPPTPTIAPAPTR